MRKLFLISGTADTVHCQSWHYLFFECQDFNFGCCQSCWVSVEQKQDHHRKHYVAAHTAFKVSHFPITLPPFVFHCLNSHFSVCFVFLSVCYMLLFCHSRFDLIFLILDPQDEMFDRRLASHLVSLYFQSKEDVEGEIMVRFWWFLLCSDYGLKKKRYESLFIVNLDLRCLVWKQYPIKQVYSCLTLISQIEMFWAE